MGSASAIATLTENDGNINMIGWVLGTVSKDDGEHTDDVDDDNAVVDVDDALPMARWLW